MYRDYRVRIKIYVFSLPWGELLDKFQGSHLETGKNHFISSSDCCEGKMGKYM